MSAWVQMNEGWLRGLCFVAVLAAMALWEAAAPARDRTLPRPQRWPHNLALVVASALLLRLAFPLLAVQAAVIAEARGWGLLNLLALPDPIEILAAFVLLDALVWAQHLASHKVALLWRLHRVHHADPDVDATTGSRFHPVEIALSMLLKIAAVVALGAAPVAVLIFEIVLNAAAMFNHTNVTLPPALDRVLRWILVPPDMHRTHHSRLRAERDSNYGFCLPWWDRWFGTYTPEPAGGRAALRIGLDQYAGEMRQSLWWMLALPFRAS